MVKLAKAMLRMLPAHPSADYKPLDQITPEMALGRTMEEIEDERQTGFLRFFEDLELPRASVALDLGCGFGGRTIEFQERIAGHLIGLEIDPRVVAPALQFARAATGASVSFVTGLGESLPLISDSIDLVLSYDVYEHVEDPAKCLAECYRVLRPGGLALLVFPPYYHPTGAHLEGYCSRMPYMNVMFPASVLVDAVDGLLDSRKDSYRPQPLRAGDRLYSLNGLTIRRFERLVRESNFEKASIKLLPLFSLLNRQYKAWKMRYYAWIFTGLSRVPLLRECFTHRVVAILRKPLAPGNNET